MLGDMDNSSAPLVFYWTFGCHLCEQAWQMIEAEANTHSLQVEVHDIAGDETLEARYGTRIPVLRWQNKQYELAWPFTTEALQAFLSEQ